MKRMIFLAAACALMLSACAYPSTTVEQGAGPAMLYFSGAPAGARVLIDGADAGEAASYEGRRQLLSIEPGRHNVRVVLNGAELYSQDVYVGANARHEVRVR